jgi:signal transduction histidine kinase
VNKAAFYYSLDTHYGVKPHEIGNKFEKFHEALKQEFGVKHYHIERLIIQCLHKQSKNAGRDRFAEISAFSQITNVFASEISEYIEKHKELADSKAYTKDLEEKVRVYDDRLKLAEHLATIGQTAAMVGHDIRNPLQAIAGDLYLIDNDVSSLPEGEVKKNLQESVNSIQANLYYINKIVSDLQDFAKPPDPNFELISIEKLIETALFIVPIPDNLEVSIDVKPNFFEFKADFYMIKRILVNLLHNAVQAMPNGGKLLIRAYLAEGHVFLEVKDTGVGIPDDIKPKLFMPMFTTKAKGQGFGLAVSKKLIEALKGSISFESETGKGTKFTLKLPC